MENPVIETINLGRSFETYDKTEGFLNSVKGLWKRKTILKQALASTTLSISPGKIIGLVGANGAGKTTLLKLLSGLIYPSSGDARVLGYRPWDRHPDYLRQMSLLLGQKNQLWWDIPAADSFLLLAKIYDLDPIKTKRHYEYLSEVLQCQDQLRTQLRRLSLGERMKMEIIGSLLHKPRVLFLDEPTIGLDIVAQNSIREFLLEYVKNEKPTVILTSHYMDDISKLADRLLLISQGSIVYDGTVESFVEKSALRQKLTVRFPKPTNSRIEFDNSEYIESGSEIFTAEWDNLQMSSRLHKILGQTAIKDIKIEEADFEHVIHKFLEQESRLRKTRYTNAT